MKLLLDTNVVIWRYTGERRLGRSASAALVAAQDIAVSVLAFVEIGVKARTGKLGAPADLEQRVAHDGMRVVGLRPADGLALIDLPLHHRDPLDRLLIAQAMSQDLTIVTSDRAFAAYDVRVLDPLT